MALDPTTEVVAHFIGLFHLDLEDLRLRSDYETFSALKAKQEFDPLLIIDINVRAPHAPREYNPRIEYEAPVPPTPPDEPASVAALPDPLSIEIAAQEAASAPEAPPAPEHDLHSPSGEVLLPSLPVPNSVVTATYQTAFLYDDDLLSQGHGAAFLPPEIFLERLSELVEVAASLAVLDKGWTALHAHPAEDIPASFEILLGEASDGALLVRGEAASGIFVNGNAAAEVPDLEDWLPARFAEDAEEAGPGSHVWTGEASSPFSLEPGHDVVTGANTVTNHAGVYTNWVDAPVIAVAGNVVNIAGISQVNVLAGSDRGGFSDFAAPSRTLNSAEISAVSSVLDEEAAVGPEPLGLPSSWTVGRLETDLVAINWVDQHIFATDSDRVEVSFTGAASYFGMGENILTNFASIAELGFHYDLILIGGSMVTLNLVEQINVLLDGDLFSGTSDAPVAAGDNLLANMAAIRTTGLDSYEEMATGFADALAELAEGSRNLSAEVAQDALFAGQDHLSVLYVAGDLIKANLVKQHTYLGDSDQLDLAQEALLAAREGIAEIVTGSNLLANTAEMLDFGLDSTVMAGGEIYTDAFIHQADLLNGAPAAGMADGAALASEAVAFLADGMIEESPDEAYGHAGATVTDQPGSLDVMQSVLA